MLDETRMRTACFARAPQRCTSRLSERFFLTFQEVTALRKTRNQLRVILTMTDFGIVVLSCCSLRSFCASVPAGSPLDSRPDILALVP
jgi:hypothetical protein